MSLDLALPEGGLQVESDPFLLEHLIFLLMGMAIESAEVGGTVTLKLKPVGRGAEVRFVGAARSKVKLKGSVQRILTLTGSTAEYEGRSDALVLLIPGRMPGGEESNDG